MRRSRFRAPSTVRLLSYFSPDNGQLFDVVRASKATGSIEVRRTNIDQITWSRWAYCKVPSSYIFTSLEQATANVAIKLSRDGANRTYLTVTPDFVAQYGFGQSALTVNCVSNGALEADILRAARGTE